MTKQKIKSEIKGKNPLSTPEVKKECQFCDKKTVFFDGVDEAGHYNYVCSSCGEPQDD